ncbi:MAG: uracil-DNA glycosylase [Thermaurantiacus sp.]
MTVAKAGEAGTPQGAAEAKAVAASLADWWRLSGHDVALAARPVPWLKLRGVRPRDDQRETARHAPRASIAPEPATLPQLSSLAELEAHVRASAPGAVFADGDPASGAMLLGEAPSAEDLRTGRPFTGPAGQLLDRMLAAIGRNRGSTYIALLVCRQPFPGTPSDEAVAADLAIARAHVRLAAPKALLLLGARPTHALTGRKEPISKLRGTWLEAILDDGSRVPALPTFNPAYLLRAPEAKREAWADLLAFAKRLSP